MRIISGKCRGTKLFSLDGNNTRPTLDRVKESLFNIINFEIQDCTFLDLFAGSGAIGIEAASRGAKKVYMCENNKEACEIVNKNIEKTRLNDVITLYNMDFQKCITDKLNEPFDIIYLDPPYKTDYAYIATKLLLENNLITDKTLIILETDSEQTVEKQFENLNLKEINKKKYGRAYLLFYKAK